MLFSNNAGCSVKVTRSVLHTLSQSATATAMARRLLLAVFDMETLLNSNLKDGGSKRTSCDDSRKMDVVVVVEASPLFRPIPNKNTKT